MGICTEATAHPGSYTSRDNCLEMKLLALLALSTVASANSKVEQCDGIECCNAKTLSKIERFEMVIFEAPERVVQVVTYDNERGLKFVDVPKHRHLMKTRHVTDLEDDRLTLQVYEEAKTCMVGKPRRHLKPKQEKEALCNFNKEFNSKHMFSSEKNSRHENLRFLPTALITHNELPHKLQPHCPSDFILQTFKYVNMDEQVIAQKPDGEVIIQDPEIQRDYRNGDFLELDEERFPEGLINITRTKRGPRCLRLKDDGQLAEAGCMWVSFSCEQTQGCPATHVYYNCKSNRRANGGRIRGCEYILLCATLNNNRCVVHSEATDVVCEQCCISDDCGHKMPKCSASEGGRSVDVSTRKLTLKVNIRKFNPNVGDYPEVNGHRQTAHISLEYKNRVCSTSVLPTDIPNTSLPGSNRPTVRLNTQGVLGDCWNEDISSGTEKMVMKLKLPPNSPIAVSKVQVIDESNHSRCWTSYWRDSDSNYNKQTNEWVTGKAMFETALGAVSPLAKNNFDADCTQ